MTIKYELKITELECAATLNGLEKVVLEVSWAYEASQGKIVTAKFGKVALSEPDASNFIPFEALTENTIQQWVFALIGEDIFSDYRSSLAVWIAAQNETQILSFRGSSQKTISANIRTEMAAGL